MQKEKIIHFIDCHHGIYIPQYFSECLNREAIHSGISEEDLDILAQGSKAEAYWDTWNDILCTGKLINQTTKQIFYLWQDGDLWLIDSDLDETEQEYIDFFGDY